MSDIIRKFKNAYRTNEGPLQRGYDMLAAGEGSTVDGPSISSQVPRGADESGAFWPSDVSAEQRDGLQELFRNASDVSPSEWDARRAWTDEDKKAHLDEWALRRKFRMMGETAAGPVEPSGRAPRMPVPESPPQAEPARPAPRQAPLAPGPGVQAQLDLMEKDRQMFADLDRRSAERRAAAVAAKSVPQAQTQEPDPILDRPIAGKPLVSDSRSGVAEHWKRKMWLKEIASRYRQQIAKDPTLMEKMVQLYDSGQAERRADVAKGGIEPKLGYHSVGAAAARNVTDLLEAQKAAQIAINVDNSFKQQNIARHLGVSRGVVMAMDDVQQSLAKGDRASAYAKMAMYGMDPRSFQGGYGVMAAEAEAKGKAKPVDPTAQQSFNAGLQTINGMQAGPDRIGAVKLHYTGALGQNAQAGAIDSAVKAHFQPHAQEYIRRGIGTLKPEERIELQQLIGQMPYDDFVKYVGAQNTPQLQQDFQHLTGRNATWGQFWSGVGSSINPFD